MHHLFEGLSLTRDAVIEPVKGERAEPYIVIAVPLMESPRKAIGVVVAHVNLRFL